MSTQSKPSLVRAGWDSCALRDALREACYAEGIIYREVPNDGRWHRADITDDPHGKDDASIKLFADGEGGVLCNWKASGKPVFFWVRQDRALTQAEQEARQRRIEAERTKADQEKRRLWDKTANRVRIEWENLPLAHSEMPQLVQKGVQAHGTKATPDGRLATPVYSPDGQIQSIQYRHADGQKRNFPCSKMEGGFWWIGTPDGDNPVFVATSFTTAASIHQALGEGHRVYISYGDGNLENVARMVQARHGGRRIVLCGDDDADKPGNPGRTTAEGVGKALRLPVALPDFGPSRPPRASDFNDLCRLSGPESVRGQILAKLSQREPGTPPPFPAFTPEELDTARLSPRCLVDHYLYADLALIAAAGGTGKTTMLIYEAVHIVLGIPLWGLKVWHPGPVLFITAEDSRELFAARLREVIAAMGLHPYERGTVLSRIAVWDVSSDFVRFAELDQGGNIRLTSLADDIITAYRDDPPAMIVFDPCVSFGPGERMVNDGEQAIVTACRRIIRGLDCCVRIVHHTGKVPAQNGALDQYAVRGGSALPDGSRMVTILSSVNGEVSGAPEGFELGPEDSGFILARAKLSYAAPQPKLYIRRRGYTFEYFTGSKPTKEQKAASKKAQITKARAAILAFIRDELAAGTKHSKKSLEDAVKVALDIPRDRTRVAVTALSLSGEIFEDELPQNERQGGKKTFLNLAESAEDVPRGSGEI